jgi:hypothetical protein
MKSNALFSEMKIFLKCLLDAKPTTATGMTAGATTCGQRLA